MKAAKFTDEVLPHLYANLEQLEKLFGSKEDLQATQAAFANRSLTPDQFFATVPISIIHILIGLRVPEGFEQLRASSPPEMQARLKHLRDQALSLFEGVESHPAVMHRITEQTRRVATRETGSSDIRLNTINSISWIPLWTHSEDGITPMVRLAFREEPNRQLLDTTLTLNGLAFVVSSLLSILSDELKRTASLCKNDTLPDVMAEELDDDHLSEMRSSFQQIEQFWQEVSGGIGEMVPPVDEQ